MKTIEVTKIDWTRIDRNHHAPEMVGDNDDLLLIDSETGEIIAFQRQIPEKYKHLKKELSRYLRFSIKYDSTASKTGAARLSGMNYSNRVFGFTAPQALRRRYGVSTSSFNKDEPQALKILEELTKVCWDTFEELAPKAAEKHLQLAQQIHPDWHIGGMPFTSGIINNSAALPYHKDSGNIKGTWNNMFCVKENVSGGGLHLPEYNVAFGIPDGSISGFDGQGAWHGVTPFMKKRNDAHRFTIVWYTKSGMVGSGSVEEETLKAKQKATK